MSRADQSPACIEAHMIAVACRNSSHGQRARLSGAGETWAEIRAWSSKFLPVHAGGQWRDQEEI